MAFTRKEPIRKPWIWVVFALLFALINPWYFPASFNQPLFWGIPAWAVVIILASLALSLFSHYVLVYHWDMNPDEQDDDESHAGDGEQR